MGSQPWKRQQRDMIEGYLDFLIAEHGCRMRGRGIAGGVEVFYWNKVAGVWVITQTREEFRLSICPLPEGKFPPAVDDHTRRDITWVDPFAVIRSATGRRPHFSHDQWCGNGPQVVAAYADALRDHCLPLLQSSKAWAELFQRLPQRDGSRK